jgi:hypothetical protein
VAGDQISIALLVAAWLVYDLVCRWFGSRPAVLTLVILGLVTATSYGVAQLYQARAAYLQVGAMLGTIMAANVLFVIIPGHRELVRAKKAGRTPDPKPGILGKERRCQQLPDAARALRLAGHWPFVYTHEDVGGTRRADGGRHGNPPLLQQRHAGRRSGGSPSAVRRRSPGSPSGSARTASPAPGSAAVRSQPPSTSSSSGASPALAAPDAGFTSPPRASCSTHPNRSTRWPRRSNGSQSRRR